MGSLGKNNKAATCPALSQNLGALFQGTEHLQPSFTLKRNRLPAPERPCLQGTDIRNSNTHSAVGPAAGEGVPQPSSWDVSPLGVVFKKSVDKQNDKSSNTLSANFCGANTPAPATLLGDAPNVELGGVKWHPPCAQRRRAVLESTGPWRVSDAQEWGCVFITFIFTTFIWLQIYIT